MHKLSPNVYRYATAGGSDPPFAKPSLALSRRGLIGAAGATLSVPSVVSVSLLSSTSAAAAAFWQTLLIEGTKALAEHLFKGPVVRLIDHFLGTTQVHASPRNGFHDSFSYGAEYAGSLGMQRYDRTGAYFGVNQKPQLADDGSFNAVRDLNWSEINNIVDAPHRAPVPNLLAGDELVRGWSGPRRPFEDHNDSQHLAYVVKPAVAADASLPGGRLDVAYVRDVCTCNGPAKAYAFHRAGDPNPMNLHTRLYRMV